MAAIVLRTGAILRRVSLHQGLEEQRISGVMSVQVGLGPLHPGLCCGNKLGAGHRQSNLSSVDEPQVAAQLFDFHILKVAGRYAIGHGTLGEALLRVRETPGMTDHLVRDWLGHADLGTTSRYLATNQPDCKVRSGRLNAIGGRILSHTIRTKAPPPTLCRRPLIAVFLDCPGGEERASEARRALANEPRLA
jgi:hypothetical protein